MNAEGDLRLLVTKGQDGDLIDGWVWYGEPKNNQPCPYGRITLQVHRNGKWEDVPVVKGNGR